MLAEEVDYLKKLNNSFHNKYVLKNDKDINQSCHEGRLKFFIKDKKMTKVQKPKVSYRIFYLIVFKLSKVKKNVYHVFNSNLIKVR